MLQLVSRFTAAALSCAMLAACAAANGTPPTASAMAIGRRAAEHPHWSKVSIGTFADPYGVAVDDAGNVYVADPGSKSIVKIAPGGERTTVGDFSAAAGSKFDPQGVSIARAPYLLYVADKGSGEIWYVKPNNTVGTIFGRVADPHYPRAVASSPSLGAVYAALATRFPLTSKGFVQCLVADCKLFVKQAFANPYGVAVDDGGSLYVADAGAKAVFRVASDGMTNIGRFADPYGVAVSRNGADVYVADAGAKKVFEGTPDGSWTDIGTFSDPYGVAVSSRGDVYVADPGSKNVWKLTP